MTKRRPTVPVVYMRGGTSKSLFFQPKDIPVAGPQRDRFLRRLMGSPHPLQIDGMGGSHVVSSKIAIVGPSERADADIDYTFCQVGITSESITYDGNCGNISAAVGPFAIEEGLVRREKYGSVAGGKIRTREVKVYNTGTKKVLNCHIPIDEDTGYPLEHGDFAIAGCPGTSAPILLDYSDVIGAALGKGPIPTDNVIDSCTINGKKVEYTISDVANIVVYARGEDFGLSGNEWPEQLDRNDAVIERIKELRGKAAQRVGMCQDWKLVDEQSPLLPMVGLVWPPSDPEAHVKTKIFIDNRCHTSYASTGAVCVTACASIPGTVVAQTVGNKPMTNHTFQLQHPMGLMPVMIEKTEGDNPLSPHFKTLSFIRTARRLCDANLNIPREIQDCMEYIPEKTHRSDDSRFERLKLPLQSGNMRGTGCDDSALYQTLSTPTQIMIN